MPAQDSRAAVTLKTAAAGNSMRIVVSDRGPGMTTTDLMQIFDPYFTTKRGGTGLGLPIAKNIVEGLGGTIAVSSILGDGTRFVIEFPLAEAERRRAGDAEGRPTT
jgi:signal transduction histidine kinase